MDSYALRERHPKVYGRLIIFPFQNCFFLFIIYTKNPLGRTILLTGISRYNRRIYQEPPILVKPHTLVCVINLHIRIANIVSATAISSGGFQIKRRPLRGLSAFQYLQKLLHFSRFINLPSICLMFHRHRLAQAGCKLHLISKCIILIRQIRHPVRDLIPVKLRIQIIIQRHPVTNCTVIQNLLCISYMVGDRHIKILI